MLWSPGPPESWVYRQTTHRGVYPRGCGGTNPPLASRCCNKVYPRGCGGTVSHFVADRSIPAGAGEPISHVVPPSIVSTWSIPAGAGEPPTRPADSRPIGRLDEVYPRGCGGTTRGTWTPYVRNGSIPAGAGEPIPPAHYTGLLISPSVYPRGCGGTISESPSLGLL